MWHIASVQYEPRVDCYGVTLVDEGDTVSLLLQESDSRTTEHGLYLSKGSDPWNRQVRVSAEQAHDWGALLSEQLDEDLPPDSTRHVEHIIEVLEDGVE